jgi:hypothetical protein
MFKAMLSHNSTPVWYAQSQFCLYYETRNSLLVRDAMAGFEH